MATVLFDVFFSLVLQKLHAQMVEADPNHEVSFRFHITGDFSAHPRSYHQQSAAPDFELTDDAVLIGLFRMSAHATMATFEN